MRKQLMLALLVLASGVQAGEDAEAVQQWLYSCERGVELPVTYVNTQAGNAYAVLQVEGQQVPMQIGMSGSGARYVSVDATRPYVWHTKGSTASLYWEMPDASPQTLFQGCQAAE